MNTSTEAISSSIYLISAFIIFVLYKLGTLTDLGFAIGYLMALMRVVAEIRGGITLYAVAYNNVPVVSRMVDLIENEEYLEPQPIGPERPVDLATASQVKLSNITYEYTKGTPVLVDVDMSFRRGNLYAIVGLSGSGKTTALEILSGMRLPQIGSIEVDDKAICPETLRSYRRQVGYGSQSPLMFQDSIRYNIGYGLSDPPQRLIEQAARDAGIHDFIADMPVGYDTALDVGGGSVSGGQKQRISLARVLAGRPSVLLLDEITSALDVRTEAQIIDTLRELSKTRIVVLSTHRLYCLQNFDWIYVLHEGRLVEGGTHDDLCRIEKGLYASLYNLQVRAAQIDPDATIRDIEQSVAETSFDRPTRSNQELTG